MDRAEKFLHEHFANVSDDESPALATGASTSAGPLPDSDASVLDEPFAKVNSVAAGSPAEQAGLKAGDEIRNFGYVNRANHDNLKKVGECVQGNEGVSQAEAIPRILSRSLTSSRITFSLKYRGRLALLSARSFA